jgi:hypothetical protein
MYTHNPPEQFSLVKRAESTCVERLFRALLGGVLSPGGARPPGRARWASICPQLLPRCVLFDDPLGSRGDRNTSDQRGCSSGATMLSPVRMNLG